VFKMIKALIFDLDGTLYLGDKAIPGAPETILTLSGHYRIFYLTNNSGKAQRQIVEKLVNLGFSAGMQNTYSVSYAMSCYLSEKKITPVYVIGSTFLKNHLVESRNIKVIDDSPSVAAVVVGLDLNLSYDKITMALHAVRNGAKLIVANMDSSYPAADGKILPGCGAMVGAVVGATGHSPDFCVGKPNTYMLKLICKENGLTPAEICVVGDVPESDIAMANNFGCQSILLDPEEVHKTFSGAKVKKLPGIIPLLKERERRMKI
jgi:4-nitrophenyl phosphatase